MRANILRYRKGGIAAITMLLASLFLPVFLPAQSMASLPNHLQRIDLVQRKNFTRVTFKLAGEPEYQILKLPENRLRVHLKDTDGARFKKLRHYADRNIGGLLVSQRGKDLLVTFRVAPKDIGWREVHINGLPAISLDIGPMFVRSPLKNSQSGRDRIISGAEKLLRDFDPPLKPEIPFIPTDKEALKGILNDADQKSFLGAEASLYKGRVTPAEEIFSQFASRIGSPIRPLALYRLAESQYRLRKYSQALGTFREAESLWRDFLSQNPASMFYYGDSIARNGDLPGGRQLLSKLIISNSDKKYAPVLLVRMADAIARQGNEPAAMAIYRTVGQEFKNNKAHQIARMKIADRSFFTATSDTYEPLAETYRDIAQKAGDFDLKEEASFKAVLLESINAEPRVALDSVKSYQKRFPKGVYIKVLHDIREDLVELVYTGGAWDKDPAGLIKVVTDNQDYLSRAFKVKGFSQAVFHAFEKVGRPLDLITFFSAMLEKPWLDEANASYMYLAIADQAETLGDSLMAKKVLRSFILRFPSDPDVSLARERLGAINYSDNEWQEVKNNLLWLLGKNQQARMPISYYYLGRTLWKDKNYQQASLAMRLYIASVKPEEKKMPPMLWDAYYIAALANQAAGNSGDAITLLESGRKIAPKENSDQFTYKLAELNLQAGDTKRSKELFEKIVKDGSDPDWKKLAAQSLEDIKLTGNPQEKSKKSKN